MNTPKLVAYYRVSTDKQGASGLGLEAQREAVNRHASAVGAEVVSEFVEIESGRRSDRPELGKALAFSRRRNATLCVAKLDRLSRNVAFLASLMESGVPFVACDNPSATPFTLHILAAVAEHEAKMISERTKSALAAYKARGGVLGGRRSNHTIPSAETRLLASQAGSRAMRESAIDAYDEESELIASMLASGRSLRDIARTFNSEGRRTRTGAEFTQATIHRIAKRSRRALG